MDMKRRSRRAVTTWWD